MFMQDRPMTRSEMNDRIQRMTEERQRQVLEARANNSQSPANSLRFIKTAEKPMTRDEMNDRIQRMMEERQRQQLSFKPSLHPSD